MKPSIVFFIPKIQTTLMLRYQKRNSLKYSTQSQRVENMVEIEIHINSPAKIGLKSKFIAIEQQYLYICNKYRSKPHIYITLYHYL